ncbi:cell division protein FtsK [Rhizocola hellebori]|uniref:Cell division protein FtsK n=1 Tax=Rhizocola hellebori TaxID=1392758 RepID=A0A8J3VJC3_9ACTN|nr:FtsK/SpoIIIE domain-containing protein [Rhizocola hellebori]GIH08530.1 cell division protein FtsK [Rhizocola hellebori]
MEWELTAVDGTGRPAAVIVRAGPAATVGDLRRAFAEAGYAAPLPSLADTAKLAQAGLVTAARLNPAAPQAAATAGQWELAAIGGCGAGVKMPLGGSLAIGRSAQCGLRLADPEVSRIHAQVRLDEAGVLLRDMGSRNGVVWGGVRLRGEAALAAEDAFGVGETVVALRRVDAADAPVEPAAQGVLHYNRPPRMQAPQQVPEFSAPGRPEKPRGVRIPMIAAALPLLLGAVVWWLFPNAGYFLIFLALSPVLLIANVISDRRSGRKEHRDAVREFEARHGEIAAQLASLAQAQGRVRRREEPDPALVERIATGPTRRLFERRPDDADFLRLRVGLGSQPVTARLTGPGAAELAVPEIAYAPIVVSLAEAGVVGLAGERDTVVAAARAAIAQLATLHAPHDLGIAVVTGQDRAHDWEWAAWLPHTLPHTADFACRRLLATDGHQAAARFGELGKLVEERLADRRSTLRQSGPAGRRMLVVVDGARQSRALPGLAELLTQGPEAGVYALCLDTTEQNLPDECRATVALSGTRAKVTRAGQVPQEEVLVDQLSAVDAVAIARALAPLRVLGGRFGAGAELPSTVRYLELAGLGPDPTAEDIIDGWSGERGAVALLGVGPAGKVEVDLRRDGPHALIAGTTGAGKSELLQTLVVSLALANPPDALNFVLVDYKGGSAFADCSTLPHCVGMVTDLDGHLVHRALASLAAELRRRERLLAAAEAKDIDDYQAKGGRLARLVIVIDEFASLLEEVPEFVSGVVGIGNRGRSLGVHVVLATQRPGGKVGADLRANLNLRVCLRVNSAEESNDVIDVPQAGRLSRHRPGRGYLRSGHGDLTEVQAARIGWPRPAERDADEVTVIPWRISELGRQPATASQAGHDGDTDLTVVAGVVAAAARTAGFSTPVSPWLPPLPEQLTTRELAAAGAGSRVTVPIGLSDQPALQAQRTFLLDLAQTGPVAVVGMARSGRSTVLRTIAAGLAERSSPADVHLYVLDQGNRALAGLAGLPHCGAYADGEDVERTERILGYLTGEVEQRGRRLADQSATLESLPYLVLLLDRYESFANRFAEADGGRLVEALDALLRRGPAVGVVVVLATDRSGFGHRLGGAVSCRLVLRHSDVEDLAAYGLNPREAPKNMPPGRAIVLPGAVEVQVAMVIEDPAARLAHRWEGMDAHLLPHRVDPLPAEITEPELAVLRAGPRPAEVGACTLGVSGDHLGPVDLNLTACCNSFLIAGPPMSGRSTALLAIARSLTGFRKAVLCPRPSPLRELDDALVLDPADLSHPLPPGPLAVFVDDAELMAEAGALEEFVRKLRDTASVAIAAGTTDDLQLQRYRGWLNLIRRNRCGLLLNPASRVDGELFELALPRSTGTGGGWPPGRALLVLRGSVAGTMQVTAAAGLPGRVQW